ncbi:Zn-dependent hydrolase [Spirosoma daeguense]
MNINPSRLQHFFEVSSSIGKIGETGMCRPAHSSLEKEMFMHAKSWMEAAGLTVRIDSFGNLIGRLAGKKPDAPILMTGSHLDTQPYGGRFDGIAGVLCAIEAVCTIAEKGIVPETSIDVIAFADEESWRFNKGLFGSRGLLGKLEPGELQRTDKDGITREQALRDFGCDITKFKDDEYAPGSIRCFLELHIEQGPILDKLNKPIGIVSGIAGPLLLSLSLKGMAGHAGSVPMPLRKDALLGAAKVAVVVNEIASQFSPAPTVGTVGTFDVFPSSRNIIPESVRMTMEFRDIDMARRATCEHQLQEAIITISQEHGLTYELTVDTDIKSSYCADWIKDTIRDSCTELGLDAPELVSGPFHDALVMSEACDFGMIFVRCKDGISHNPLEYASYEDLALGSEVLYQTILKIVG